MEVPGLGSKHSDVARLQLLKGESAFLIGRRVAGIRAEQQNAHTADAHTGNGITNDAFKLCVVLLPGSR